MDQKIKDFTSGPILGPLLAFSMPILLALFLLSLYGAADLLISGKYALAHDVTGITVCSQTVLYRFGYSLSNCSTDPGMLSFL